MTFLLCLGHTTHRLPVERGVGASKNREVVVWCIAFLSDHTIISGDSAGKVQIWDGLTGMLIQTHLVTKWDVLALSVSQVSAEFRQSHKYRYVAFHGDTIVI